MGTLHAAIDALETVSIVLGMVPLIGESLKSAAELASKICEQVQKIQENREGYERLGVQVAGLLTAVASVLQQTRQDEALERVIQTNVNGLLKVLEEIKATVEKRVHSGPEPTRKRDVLLASIRKKAKDTKSKYKYQDELEQMRRKLQSVVDGFMISSLLRNELSSLQNGSDLNDVRMLASRILELQMRQDVKRDAEAVRAKQDAELIKRDADIALLDSLGPIVSAAWNATGADGAASAHDATISMCTPGTRLSILSDLLAWAIDSNSPCVFWLNGLAGTGKSTIARTLCERLDQQGLLGASFFISRDQPERREPAKIVRSVAHQLAANWPLVSDALCAKLRETPLSVTRSLQQQITDFIITPARELTGNTSFIIVIDALDESVTDFHGRPGGELLLLLGRQLLQLAGRVRLFITSRNEIPIQQMFLELSANSQTVVKLHDLDQAVVKADITTYLTQSFSSIRKARLEISLSDWPTTEAVHELVQMSGLLFIYAATAVRFMSERRYSPRHRLSQLLGQGHTFTTTSPYAQLDGLYRQILNDAVRDSRGEEDFLCQRLHAVMAMIVLALSPLKIEALATLSGLNLDDASIAVGSLASLLADSTSGVRVFHPSFPDFAVDATRCMDLRLRVIPIVDHAAIALRCLDLMNKHLRYNICGIQDPTIANKNVEHLDVALRENVSDALRYAVCFSCTHLAASGVPDGLLLDSLDEFCKKHLFHWVEVLSLAGHVIPAEAALLQVIEWCENHPSDTTTYGANLLRDLLRALQVFATPIRSHALHAYHSALVTMPQCLLLNTVIHDHVPHRLPRLVSPRAAHWGPSPRVLEGHSNLVRCVAYSPDGTRIVSGSSDYTMRIWNAITFEQLAELTNHQNWVDSVSYSADGTLIVSGSFDKTVRIWNAVTFEQLAELRGHDDWVRSAAFSPDGTHIVSGSDDRTVRVWNVATFEQLAELKGHERRVWSVAFSPNGAHIASSSEDHTVRIWNAATFHQLAELKGHEDRVRSVAFAPDGAHIMSCSDDYTVRTWDAVTFEQLAERQTKPDWVTTVAFSPDGTRIVCSTFDYNVHVWNSITHEKLAKLKGHQGAVISAVFSPDGTHIVSCSNDGTLRVWDGIIFDQVAEIKGHQRWVRSVAFSSDGTHIASGSDDGTVCVWTAVTFERLAQLEGLQTVMKSVTFSNDNKTISSRDWDGKERSWTCSNGDFVAWRETSFSTESLSGTTSVASSSDIEVTLSDSGWLSCEYDAGRILLWLPVERRGKAIAGSGRRVAIGAISGAVTLLELPTELA